MKHHASVSTKKGSVITPSHPTPEGQALTTPTPEVNPEVKISLTLIAKGWMIFDPQWKAHNAKILIESDLLNIEGSKLDEHPILGIGSAIDRLDNLMVIYREGSKRAYMRATKILTPEEHFEVVGVNTKGEVRELSPLMVKGKNDKGEETQVLFSSKSKCNTSRFLVRELTSHLLRLIDPKIKDTSTLTLANLMRDKFNAQASLNKIAVKFASTPTHEVQVILDEASMKLVKIEGDIAKMQESLTLPNLPDIAKILEDSRKRALTPTSTPEVKEVASTQP